MAAERMADLSDAVGDRPAMALKGLNLSSCTQVSALTLVCGAIESFLEFHRMLKLIPFRSKPGPLRQKLHTHVALTGVERTFPPSDIIVSKTCPKGVITYANKVFLDVARLTESQVVGAAHSVVRHPDMPRAVFALMWSRLQAGQEIFAYVLNMTSCGDHYWVHAHVTPSFGADGQIIGYHSNRRVPDRSAVDTVAPIYRELKAIEDRAANRADGLKSSVERLNSILRDAGVSYDQYVFSLAS